jgi:hypothetical protein
MAWWLRPESSAARRAERRDVKAVVAKPLLREPVEGRRPDRPAEAGGIPESRVVDEDEQDVGRARGRRRRHHIVRPGPLERPVGDSLERSVRPRQNGLRVGGGRERRAERQHHRDEPPSALDLLLRSADPSYIALSRPAPEMENDAVVTGGGKFDRGLVRPHPTGWCPSAAAARFLDATPASASSRLHFDHQLAVHSSRHQIEVFLTAVWRRSNLILRRLRTSALELRCEDGVGPLLRLGRYDSFPARRRIGDHGRHVSRRRGRRTGRLVS